MRFQLMRSFSSLFVVDLHGSTKKGEASPDGTADENVFAILPGVAIGIGAVSGVRNALRSFDLWGSRASKFEWLTQHGVSDTGWRTPSPRSPYFLFVERDISQQSEYDSFISLKEILPFFGTGIQTSRDAFASDIEKAKLEVRIDDFFDLSISDAAIAEKYGLTDTRGWKIHDIRRNVSKRDVKRTIVPFSFRVFDTRWIALTKSMVDWPRADVMSCVGPPRRLGLLCARQQAVSGFRHAFVVNAAADMFFLSNKSREGQTLFPLYRSDALTGDDADAAMANLGAKVRAVTPTISNKSRRKTEEAIFFYVYAVLHSLGYRTRYADLLKMDYPKIPFSSSPELFSLLAECGRELVELHLLESANLEKPTVRFAGSRNPVVERITWSDDTVRANAFG